jgi:hypothetical protein
MTEFGGRRSTTSTLAAGCMTASAGCGLYYFAPGEDAWVTTLLALTFMASLVMFLSMVLPQPMWTGGP